MALRGYAALRNEANGGVSEIAVVRLRCWRHCQQMFATSSFQMAIDRSGFVERVVCELPVAVPGSPAGSRHWRRDSGAVQQTMRSDSPVLK